MPDVKITDIDFVSGSLMIDVQKNREYREVYLNNAEQAPG